MFCIGKSKIYIGILTKMFKIKFNENLYIKRAVCACAEWEREREKILAFNIFRIIGQYCDFLNHTNFLSVKSCTF